MLRPQDLAIAPVVVAADDRRVNLAVAGGADLTESIDRQALVRAFDRVMLLYGGLCAWACAGASRLVLGRNGR
ncbi:hypothetical protein [Methylobacterium sp. ARG-1]|uniref:hypothetical protein n=1 Tax=Methylobacterium sp. ARG-1 TaxID=1692501 RepID=UPI001187321A|nr:hypothetical protein [Methylobacterium sp. ARG-1]